MKYTRLSTTSKLYLLVLLLIFGIIFLNKSASAQLKVPGATTTTQKRLQNMELYQSWINNNTYGTFKTEQGNQILSNFKTFLSKSVPEDKSCLESSQPTINTPATTHQENTFFGNIETFFTTLIHQGQTPTPQTQPMNCTSKIKEDYKLAKKYNRALKYLQIKEGKPNVCIKADLGIGTALTAHGFNPTKVNSDNSKETGRTGELPVYLCTGNDGKPKVRVVDDSGTRLRLAPDDAAKAELKVENLPPKGNFEELVKKLGL